MREEEEVKTVGTTRRGTVKGTKENDNFHTLTLLRIIIIHHYLAVMLFCVYP